MTNSQGFLFCALSFKNNDQLIDLMGVLENEIGKAFYFSGNFSVPLASSQQFRLLAYRRHLREDKIASFYSSQKKVRKYIKDRYLDLIIGFAFSDKVVTLHEDASPFRLFMGRKSYAQIQLTFSKDRYHPASGAINFFHAQTATVFFSDLRRITLLNSQ